MVDLASQADDCRASGPLWGLLSSGKGGGNATHRHLFAQVAVNSSGLPQACAHLPGRHALRIRSPVADPSRSVRYFAPLRVDVYSVKPKRWGNEANYWELVGWREFCRQVMGCYGGALSVKNSAQGFIDLQGLSTEQSSDVPLMLALYQPDIPQNTGTMLRACACLGVAAAIIEPAGFPISDRNFRRAGMDYLDKVDLTRHISWRAFEEWRAASGRRLALLTTKGAQPYTEFAFKPGDIVMVGRESAGVPDEVHERADARLVIPMRMNLRSLNVAVAATMVIGEAIRQIGTGQTGEQNGR